MWPSRRISPSKQRYCVAWEEDGKKKKKKEPKHSEIHKNSRWEAQRLHREAGGGKPAGKQRFAFCCRSLWIIKQWHKLSLVARLLYNPTTKMDSGCMTAVMFTKQNCSSGVLSLSKVNRAQMSFQTRIPSASFDLIGTSPEQVYREQTSSTECVVWQRKS